MDKSPLPSRARPGTLAADASLSNRRNPFSLAKASFAKSSVGRPTQRVQAHQKAGSASDDDIEDSSEEMEEEDEDEDELAGVGGFASSPYFTQPTQAVTQPTQLIKNITTLKRSAVTSDEPMTVLSSSPPPSIVEVPASSPFQSPKPHSSTSVAPGRLASLMAPAGTAFRSPAQVPTPRPLQRQRENARASANGGNTDDDDDLDAIVRIDDSSDDGNSRAPARGDIRPSSFRRPSPLPAAKPRAVAAPQSASSTGKTGTATPTNNLKTLNDRKMSHLIIKVQGLLRNKGYNSATTEACRSALLKHDYSVDEATKDLFYKRLTQSSSPVQQSKVPDMIRSFAYQANGSTNSATAASSPSSSPASSQQSPKKRTLSPSPRPKRRRLVQGRRNQAYSSQPEMPAPERTRLVDLTGDDDMDESEAGEEEDDDEGDSSPPAIASDYDGEDDDVVEIDDEDSMDDDNTAFNIEKRVLEYFNTCTVDDLVAMLGAKAKGKAETILSQRPFQTRASVTRVRNTASSGSRGKKASANIGEDIFDAVEEYVVALQAIDVVVTQCEQKGLRIRSTLHRWNVDFRGSSKARESGTGEPLTPSSEFGTAADKGGYVPLPIPQEPVLMRGHCTMKGYQLFGLNWLWDLYQRKFGCILADDMGLGKTCQVISFLSQVVGSYAAGGGRDDDDDEARPWPNLVVVPPSTLANWKAEFKKFSPRIRVTTYSGSVAEREQIYYRIQENRAKHHVVLTSYSQLSGKQDLDAMRKIAPNAAIFDEGHKMKNSNTALYKSLKRIDANWRLILTGTPVQNNLMEMINLLNFIQPTLFERHLEKLGALFSQRFTLQDVSNGALLFSDRVRRARSILEPFILQRRKEQVLSSMPSKTTRVMYCDLDATQKPIYETYERQFREGKNKTSQKQPPATKTRSAVTGLTNDQNNVWVQLRKSAIHAQLFRRYFDDKTVEQMAQILMAEVPQSELRQPDLKHLIGELRDCSDFELHTWCRDYRCIREFDFPDDLFLQSGKVQELLRLVQKFQKNGDRALVFTRFARVLNILRECMTTSGLDYVSLEGATRVEERQAIIDEFNSNADIPVFLLTTGSGGTGINLTAANKVIIFDQSDNPQDDVQAENRAHRLGQTRDVEVIKLVTRGTIEELVYKACQTKLELAERVTASSTSSLPPAVDEMDGEKIAKAVEEDVRKMLLAKDSTTPPKSDDGDE